MSVITRGYQYKLEPTAEQENLPKQFAGARRWVYNWGLARKKEHYAATGKSLSTLALMGELTVLKLLPDAAWLREMDSQALQQALRDLDRAYTNFFEKRAKFPRFAKKHDLQRFRVPQRVRLEDGKLFVPKIGHIKLRLHRPLVGEIKSATFKQTATREWYVSLTVHSEILNRRERPLNASTTIGIDLGLKDFATLSTGEKVPAPRFYRRSARVLRRAQQMLARRVKGSKGRARAKTRVAKVHERIRNCRKDFLHKLSRKLVREFDTICIEDLSVKGLARTKLAKSMYDASMGTFRFYLTYKAEQTGTRLVVISRWYPSTKLCGACGALNDALTLSDRVWTCSCGVVHDRDLNAARNIATEGLRCAGGHPEQTNAGGASVRLLKRSNRR